MRILHLVDDWLFTDGTVSVFKAFDIENKFVVLRIGDDKTRYNIKSAEVEIIQVGTDAYNELLESMKWDLVWVYQLVPAKAEFVSKLDKSVPVMWSVYGIDYIKYSGRWLYGRRTTRLFRKLASNRTFVVTIAKYIAGRLGVSRFLPFWDCRFFRRINYFSCVVPEEELWVRGAIGKRKSARRLNFHFCSNDKTYRSFYPTVNLLSKKVWVGNSATLSNNHLDVFELIKQSRLNDEYNIISPLSYSYDLGAKDLPQIVADEGRRCFGSRFTTVTDVLPREEYINLMSSCSIFVFGVRRQQAGGNIRIALTCGGCVFLDRRNPIYEHYLNKGVLVYPIERIEEGFDKIIEEFRPHQRQNIEILCDRYGVENRLSEINDTVRFLRRDICCEYD